MVKVAKTRLSRGLFLDRDIERFREHLVRFRSIMAKAVSSPTMAEFDQETEGLISQVFGEASELLEAYEYAQLGEASTLVNLPEEAQEPGAQDLERESQQQRKRVLESCISELETRRADAFRKRRLQRLKAPQVADFMSSEIHSLSQNAVLTEAGTLLKKHKIGSLLVEHETRYVGILTEADICRKGVAEGLDPGKTPVKACMSNPIISIEGHEPILEAVQLMKAKGIRHLAVTENTKIVGILSVADLVKYYSGVQ